MESESSLSCLQEYDNYPYSEPVKFSPNPDIIFV
jgi:hypothetical protein